MVRGSVDDAEKEEDRRQRVLRGIVQDSIIGATLFGLAVGFFGSAGRSVGLLLHLVCGAAAGAALTPAWADRGRGAAIFGLGALLAAALSGDLALVGPALLVRLLVLGAAGSLLGHNRSLGRTGG